MSNHTDSRVFVVDDDEAVRDSLLVLLGNRGWATMAFESADAFLQAFRPEWKGCILLDIRMPGTDGMTLLRQLKDQGCTLPIIMMTGHGDVPTAVRAMRTGAFDFLEKPFTQDVIFAAVERARATLAQARVDIAPPSEVTARLERLTVREREVLDRLVIGATNKEIARQLDISPRTVEIHRSRVMEKMETPTLSHLVRLAIGAGIVSVA